MTWNPARTLFPVSGLVAAVLATTAPLHAQVELGLFGGVLAPTSEFTVPSTGAPFGSTTAKFTTTLTYGALGRWWITERVGVQGTVGWAGGSLQLQPPFSSAPDTTYSASTTTVTAVLIYRLSAPTIRNTVWLSGGAAWIDRSSPRLDGLDGTNSLGMTFGLGSTLPIGHSLSVNLGLDTFIYSFALQSPTDAPAGTTQFEFRGLAGLSMRLGH
jgi:hypothetical protein